MAKANNQHVSQSIANTMLATVVSMEEYQIAMASLLSILNIDFDCIVSLKRSGFILGVFLSNQTGKPLFTPSEIKSIPIKYKKVLVVDDKVCKGKSIKKVSNKINSLGKNVTTACLFVEGYFFTDYYTNFLNGKIVKMWYECHIHCRGGQTI